MTTTTQTEQQNYDALLAGEIPEKLREAVTKFCKSKWHIGGHKDSCERCFGTWRVPLPLDSAHVAAERWTDYYHRAVRGNGEIEHSVVLPGVIISGYGADIFAAIGAALKGGE